jgi:hypothetical protein
MPLRSFNRRSIGRTRIRRRARCACRALTRNCHDSCGERRDKRIAVAVAFWWMDNDCWPCSSHGGLFVYSARLFGAMVILVFKTHLCDFLCIIEYHVALSIDVSIRCRLPEPRASLRTRGSNNRSGACMANSLRILLDEDSARRSGRPMTPR